MNGLIATGRRQTVEPHVFAGWVENEVFHHTAERVVLFFFFCVAQDFGDGGIGDGLNDEVAHAFEVTLVDTAPWRWVAVQNYAHVGFAHGFPCSRRSVRVGHCQFEAGFQVEQGGVEEGYNVAMQQDKEPVVEVQLRLVGQGFGLQDAVVPLVTYVNVRIGILVPLSEILLFGDATPFVGGPIAGAKGSSRPLCGTAVIRNDILLFAKLLLH